MTDRLTEIMEEMLVWTKASCYENVKTSMLKVLIDEKAIAVYDSANGQNSISELKSIGRMGQGNLYRLLNKCVSMGLMAKTPQGRYLKLFEISDFDITKPELGQSEVSE